MGRHLTIDLIDAAKLPNPDGFIKRDNLPDVPYYNNLFWKLYDEADLRLSSKYNFYCWEKLLVVMNISQEVEDYIKVEKSDIEKLKKWLQEILHDPDFDEDDRHDHQESLNLIEETLNEYEEQHAIIVSYF